VARRYSPPVVRALAGGARDRPLGLRQRLGVGAREEAQLPLDGGQLAAHRVLARERLGLGDQLHGAVQVAALERDRRLQDERAAAQRSVVAGASDLVAADRLRFCAVLVFVEQVTRAIQRAMDLDCGHHNGVRPLPRRT
jgi:hypothetical protein